MLPVWGAGHAGVRARAAIRVLTGITSSGMVYLDPGGQQTFPFFRRVTSQLTHQHRMSASSPHGRTAPFPGKGGVEISQLGFGAMGLSAFYGNASTQEEGNAVLDELLRSSPHPVMIDTAEIYTRSPGNGDNERMIGSWLKTSGQRKNVFIATKFGFGPQFEPQASREDAHIACNKSLERLGVDAIDLYYIHRPDRKIGVETTFQGLKELKEQGKIRYVGCSEFSLEELKRANEIVHVDAFQIELSPWTPEPLTNGLVDWCRENGTAVVAYSPLGRGALAQRFKSHDEIPEGDFRKHNERFQGENFAKNQKLVEDIEKIGKAKGATSGQVTLAWLMSLSKSIFPIPGTTNVGRAQENSGAARVQLTPQEVDEISSIIKSFKVSGRRYPEAMAGSLAF